MPYYTRDPKRDHNFDNHPFREGYPNTYHKDRIYLIYDDSRGPDFFKGVGATRMPL